MESDTRQDKLELTGIKLIFFGIAFALIFMPVGKSGLFYWATHTPKYLALGVGAFTALTGLLIHSTNQSLKVSKLNFAACLLLLLTALSTFLSIEPRTSVFGLYSTGDSLALAILLFVLFVSAQQLEPKLTDRLFSVITLPVIPVAALAAFEAFYLNYYRSASFMTNPVYLGAYAALMAPMILYQLEQSKTARKKLLNSFLLFCCLLTLVLSYSRIPLILVAGLLMWHIYKSRLKKMMIPTLLLAAALIAFVHGSFFSSQGPQLTARILGLLQTENYGPRIEMAKTALRVIDKFPVMGGGPGTYSYIAAPFVSKKYVDSELFTEPETIMKGEPHNVFLVLAATLGLPGLTVFIWMLAFLALKYRNVRRRLETGDETKQVNVLLLICGFFIVIKLSQPNQMLEWVIFWTAAGLIAGRFAGGRSIKIPVLPMIPAVIIAFFAVVLIPAFSNKVLADAATGSYWHNFNYSKLAYKINPLNDYALVHAAKNMLYEAKYGNPFKSDMHIQNAVGPIEEATTNSPHDVYFRLVAADVYTRMSEADSQWLGKAELHLDKAVQTYPNHPVPKKLLAENLLKQNRRTEAKRIARSIAEYKGSVEGLDELLKTIGD